MNIILASKSPRREKILSRLNVAFKIVLPKVNEKKISHKYNGKNLAIKLSEKKALEVAKKFPNSLVIGADTIVIVGNQILGKPIDKIDAKRMLTLLSNNQHQVITGVCLVNMKKNIKLSFYEKTIVTFHDLSDDEINSYIERNNPFDKSGSYGIQDQSAIFVKNINGCYDNVVGFPLSKFYQKMKSLNIKV